MPYLSSNKLSETSSIANGDEGPLMSFMSASSSNDFAKPVEAPLDAVAVANAWAERRERVAITSISTASIMKIVSMLNTSSRSIPRRGVAWGDGDIFITNAPFSRFPCPCIAFVCSVRFQCDFRRRP